MKNTSKLFLLLFFFLGMSVFVFAQGCPLCASLEIKVAGLKNEEGIVRIMLTRDATTFEELDPAKIEASKIYFRNAAAKKDGVIFTFSELPSGAYAYKIFHDANNNELIDTTLLGKPTESVAVSGYKQLKDPKVSFERAKFKVAPRAKIKRTVNL